MLKVIVAEAGLIRNHPLLAACKHHQAVDVETWLGIEAMHLN